MKITKQIEVTVCDRCSKEGYAPEECGICKKAVLRCCTVYHTITVERREPSKSGFSLSIYDGPRDGMRIICCVDCSKIVEGKMAELGFSAFKTKPVIPL